MSDEFELITAQVQFWAEIGSVDNGGMGYIKCVTESKAFPSFELAEQWLTEQGWVYDDHLLRRIKPENPYGIARTRRVEEQDKDKWIVDEEQDDDSSNVQR